MEVCLRRFVSSTIILMQMRLITKLWNWITQHCVILVNYSQVLELSRQVRVFNCLTQRLFNYESFLGAKEPTKQLKIANWRQPVSLSTGQHFPFSIWIFIHIPAQIEFAADFVASKIDFDWFNLIACDSMSQIHTWVLQTVELYRRQCCSETRCIEFALNTALFIHIYIYILQFL